MRYKHRISFKLSQFQGYFMKDSEPKHLDRHLCKKSKIFKKTDENGSHLWYKYHTVVATKSVSEIQDLNTLSA